MKDVTLKDNTEAINLIQQPFIRKYDPEDQEETEGERITIRINKAEREIIDLIKDLTAYNSDSTVIKQGLTVYKNVLLNTLGAEVVKKISSQTRRKPIK